MPQSCNGLLVVRGAKHPGVGTIAIVNPVALKPEVEPEPETIRDSLQDINVGPDNFASG